MEYDWTLSWDEPSSKYGKTYRAVSMACAKLVKEQRPDYDREAYARGWNASLNAGDYTLDNADGRGEPKEWYDGYFDVAVGRDRWHTALGHPTY